MCNAFFAHFASLCGGFLFCGNVSIIFERKRQMKKIRVILALFVAAAMLLCAVGCAESNNSGTITVVVAEETPLEYTVSLDKIEGSKGVVSVLEYLNTEKGLAFEMSGTMINKVGSLENNDETWEYIYLYTSVAQDVDVSEYATTVEYKGQTLTSSGVGASDMHLEDGAIIYIGTIIFG